MSSLYPSLVCYGCELENITVCTKAERQQPRSWHVRWAETSGVSSLINFVKQRRYFLFTLLEFIYVVPSVTVPY